MMNHNEQYAFFIEVPRTGVWHVLPGSRVWLRVVWGPLRTGLQHCLRRTPERLGFREVMLPEAVRIFKNQ